MKGPASVAAPTHPDHSCFSIASTDASLLVGDASLLVGSLAGCTSTRALELGLLFIGCSARLPFGGLREVMQKKCVHIASSLQPFRFHTSTQSYKEKHFAKKNILQGAMVRSRFTPKY